MNKVHRKFFIAYGSLMNVDKMVQVCPESYVFGWGSIQDFELEVRALENLKSSAGCNVPVVLYSITAEDEMELDSFFDLEVYRKDEINVILTDVNDVVAPYSAEYYREGIKGLVYIMKDGNLKKPTAALVGANGNIYNLMGIASQALIRAGQQEQDEEMQKRILNGANNYNEAIQIIIEYVEVE